VSWRLSRQADGDLVTVYVNGVLGFGAERAEDYQTALWSKFDLIAANPGLGRRRDGRKRSARVHSHRAHIIVYRIENDEDVVILRVFHQRENWVRYFG
jgi:toxin ParE1/3/4